MRTSTFLMILGVILFIATIYMTVVEIIYWPVFTGIFCWWSFSEGYSNNLYEGLNYQKKKYIFKRKNGTT